MLFPRKLTVSLFSAMVLLSTLSFGQQTSKQASWSLPDFSATEYMLYMGQALPGSKVYLLGDKFRVEPAAEQAMIYVPSLKKAYHLMFIGKPAATCIDMPIEKVQMLPSPMQLISGTPLEWSDAGEEKVEGHSSKVQNAVFVTPSGKKVESKVWRAQDLGGVPVKVEARVGDTVFAAVYRDITLESPSEDLFTRPAKCTPLDKIGQVAPNNTKPGKVPPPTD
jgi:hypothetical protein